MKHTNIEWADFTGSPWYICTEVNEDCANCYARELAKGRMKTITGGKWGKGVPRVRAKGFWSNAIKWNETPWVCDTCGKAWTVNGMHPDCDGEILHRARMFPSLCDWLDAEVQIEWLADFLKLVYGTPNLDWLLLTKRPENFFKRLSAAVEYGDTQDWPAEFLDWVMEWFRDGIAPANVWILASAGNQKNADKMMPELLKIPARVRGLSAEPLIGPITFRPDWLEGLDWIIFGGESTQGKPARPCNIEWIVSGLREAQAVGVNCFVKQVGTCPVIEDSMEWRMGREGDDCREFGSPLVGDVKCEILTLTEPQSFPRRKMLLKDRKGGDWNEWPEHLRVREYPN